MFSGNLDRSFVELEMLSLVFIIGLGFVSADITGTNPPNGACLCMTHDSVNIRETACGTVYSSANTGSCFNYKGGKVGCSLSGVAYEFFEFDYNGRSGWAAGDFMEMRSTGGCSAPSGEGYTCQVTDQGRRIHETTSATPYDCVDGGCGNNCHGGQCVAYVTCRCTKPGTTNHVPNTSCWRPGTKVVGADGRCNRNIAQNTAIATFQGQNYYAGHAAVFTGCSNDYTIQVYDQWCCKSIGYSTYSSTHSYYNTFHVITNPGVCADRSSWPCRSEPGGGTCCEVSESGCLKQEWWKL